MQQKDYYQVLRISPTSTADEVKAAFRKLAIKYHPDKNNGDTLSEAIFKDVNEAYSVLSNPQKRAKFDRDRVATPSVTFTTKKTEAVNAKMLMQQAAALNKLLSVANPFTIDKDAVFFKISSILSAYNINLLLVENNAIYNANIIQQLLYCCKPLSLADTNLISVKLLQLARRDAKLVALIARFLEMKKWEDYWQRYKFFVVFILVFLMCLFIYSL